MPEIAGLPGGGGGGVGGVPTKWLLIGGVGVLVGVVFLMSKKGGGAKNGSDPLSTNAAVALADLQYQQQNLYGELSKQQSAASAQQQHYAEMTGAEVASQTTAIGSELAYLRKELAVERWYREHPGAKLETGEANAGIDSTSVLGISSTSSGYQRY